MDSKKAIEIKARTGEEFLNTDPDEIDEADRLSDEALKRHQRALKGFTNPEKYLLPGETTEKES